jgi:hypothetical protein
MSNKQQTPVSWLVEQFKKDIIGLEFDYKEEINQALEMEKQQIIDAWENGYEHGACVNEDEDKYHGIQYYNEIYER